MYLVDLSLGMSVESVKYASACKGDKQARELSGVGKRGATFLEQFLFFHQKNAGKILF